MQVDWLSGYIEPRGGLYIDPEYRPWDGKGKRHLLVSPDGELLDEKALLEPLAGSHDDRLFWSSGSGRDLYLSGNPVKFFQGHNLFGSDDVIGLWVASGVWAEVLLDGDFPGFVSWPELGPGEMSFPVDHVPTLTRVDITRSYRFSSNGQAREWLRSVAGGAHAGRLKKEITKGGTVYFGKGSRRWMFKMYSKFDELKARGRGHKLPAAMPSTHRRRLEDWAEGVVRFELQLRGLEMRSAGIGLAELWPGFSLHSIWSKYHDRIQYNRNSEAVHMDDLMEANLTPRQRVVLDAWRRGSDLRQLETTRTFYRIRRQLLDAVGVDIAEPPASGEAVVSSELDPAGWDPAPEKDLIFEPDLDEVRQRAMQFKKKAG